MQYNSNAQLVVNTRGDRLRDRADCQPVVPTLHRVFTMTYCRHNCCTDDLLVYSPYNVEDRVMVKNLYKFKGYCVEKLVNFVTTDKGWNVNGLNYLG